MSTGLKSALAIELSKRFPAELVNDLIYSYERVLVEYKKGAWDETLWKAGKFVENIFRLLHFVTHGIVPNEVLSISDLKRELENLPSSRFPDSIRLLIPRIATAMIYDPRSKKGAVHVKPVNPDYLDATLAVSACDWLLAELVRLYHTQDSKQIQSIIHSLLIRKVPFVEKHEGKSFVTVPMGAEDEILLLLLDNPDGLDRTTIGECLKNNYTQGRVTQALQELLRKKRFVVETSSRNYAITGPGEQHISGVIAKIL